MRCRIPTSTKLFGLCKLLPVLAAAVCMAPVIAQDTLKIIAQKDVIYGRVEGAALLADIAYPESRDHLPAILIVHGGRWRAGSRSDEKYAKQDAWARDGFFAMNIDYRLVNSTPAPACYQDMYTAIRWLHSHASEYHIDTGRIYLMGNSSGGAKSLSRRLWARGLTRKPAGGSNSPGISGRRSASRAPMI